MAKRLVLVGILSALAASAALAGDVATFVNLGFSEDSRYFMFAQFGVLEKSSTPYADSFVVDVRANSFVSQGVRKVAYTKSVEPGNNGEGALFNLVGDSTALTRQYRINHLLSGRLLYLLVDGGEAIDSLEFRDFLTASSYKVDLLQNATEKGSDAVSSYHIQLTVTQKDGTTHSLDIGNPRIQRSGVKSYHIKQIILAPDGESLVFVIQRAEQDTHGSNIRYMVETAKVN
jgi:predicted secreted protein